MTDRFCLFNIRSDIIGFDGEGRGRQLETGALTTIEAPMKKMGQLAVRLLAERLADPDQPVRRLAEGCSLFVHRNISRNNGRSWIGFEALDFADQPLHPAILPDGKLVVA